MESGFYCKCGVNRIMRTYFGAEYLDYFTGMIGGHITVEGLVELAAREHMLIDPARLQKKLQKYDLDNLTEPEFFDMASDVLSCNDVFRFRRELVQFSEAEPMLTTIARRNPRIDIPGLQRYLHKWRFSFSEKQVIGMERAIAWLYYHPKIDIFTEW